jgi:hypothetical protein
LSLDDEVALDLGCERCARVYLAVLGRGGTSWLNQIVRDTGMAHKTVKRHLSRLLAVKLVANDVFGYRIFREIDSARPLGFLEILLPKDLLAKVRKLILKRPDLGFVDREEEFIREAIRRFLHNNRTSLRASGPHP